MIHPISGKEMVLKSQKRIFAFHGQSFEIEFNCFYCDISKEEYVTTLQEKDHLKQLHIKYCKKNDLILPNDIKLLRHKYDLSISDLAKLLKIKLVDCSNLELGLTLPIEVNSTLKKIEDPNFFMALLDQNKEILSNYHKIRIKAQKSLIPEEYYGQHDKKNNEIHLKHQKYWSKYSLPNDLRKLMDLNLRSDFDTSSIGFFIDTGWSSQFGPIDLLVFGRTGGDGGLFGFLTDFGYYEDLNSTPIVFHIPCDFCVEYPMASTKIIASNFHEFLRLMITIYSAELLRSIDISRIDFDNEVNEFLSTQDIDDQNVRLKTIETLKSEFGVNEIPNVKSYFFDLYSQRRNNPYYVDLVDGLGVNFKDIDTKKLLEDYKKLKSNTDPIEVLGKLNLQQKKLFIREDIFTYYSQKKFNEAYRYQIYLDNLKSDLMPNEVMNLESLIEQYK